MFGSINRFYDEVKQEIKKVTWPTKQEVLSCSIMVFVAVIFCGIAVLCVDYLINTLVQYLLIIG